MAMAMAMATGRARRTRGGGVAATSSVPTLPVPTNQTRLSSNNNVGRSAAARRRRGGGSSTTTIPALPVTSDRMQPSPSELPSDPTNNNNDNKIGRPAAVGTQRVARYLRVADCSCESCTLRSSGDNGITKWQASDAKAVIRNALLSDKTHNYWNDPPAKVFDDNKTLFHLYKYENFSNNLRSLRRAILLEQEKTDFDETAIERESIAFPRGLETSHGNLYYDTSETKKLLVGLAKEGKLEQYKHHPRDLKKTNPIFDKEFNGKVFAKAVNREKRRVKETAGWQMKRNIRGSKKHNAKYNI